MSHLEEVLRAQLVQQAQRDRQEQAQQVPADPQVQLELRVIRARLVRREVLGPKDPLDTLELPAVRAQLVKLAQRGRRDRQVQREVLDLLEILDQLELQEILDRRERLALLGQTPFPSPRVVVPAVILDPSPSVFPSSQM